MAYFIDVYNTDGKVLSKVELNESIFSESLVNNDLIHEFLLLQLSNSRNSIANTKTRGEVSGSNKKIFKQKGTGNARAGEKRSPIRKGGGVVFGPRTERNFTKNMNKKTRKLAMNGLITLRAKDGDIIAIDSFNQREIKTKNAVSILKNIGIDSTKVLLIMNDKNDIVTKSFKNIENVKYLLVDYINPHDFMNYNKVLFEKSALDKINK